MKQRALLLLLLVVLLAFGVFLQNREALSELEKEELFFESPPVMPSQIEEIRAVWITQFELNAICTESEDEFRASFSEMMKNCHSLGLNTVFVQVRPNGDAFYPSAFFPWSVYLAPAEGNYDPLAIMVKEAHRYGLSFHAWLNPFRLQTEKQLRAADEKFLTKQWWSQGASGRVRTVNGVCYLDPGFPEARELIFDGVREIIENYPIDGIHIDDYFYPSTDESFDDVSFGQYGNGRSLEEFRFSNVNETVKGIYETIRSHSPSVSFGVSPAGNQTNNYRKLYADTKKWMSEEGYFDYIIPQIYWNYDHSTAPFLDVLKEWDEAVSSPSVKLIAGLATYKIDGEGWKDAGSIMKQMIEDVRETKNGAGVSFYSYGSLCLSKSEAMLEERSQIASLFRGPDR